VITQGYFRTMRIPLRRGRDITTADEAEHAHVVLLDEFMARRYWPGGDAIGHRISVDDPTKGADWFTVIGVVGNIQQSGGWADPRSGQMYFPYWMNTRDTGVFNLASLLYPSYMTLVLRYRGDPAPLRREIEKVVEGLDADAPIAGVITMDEAIADQVAEPRFYLVLLGGFAALALPLAAVGVYGVISHTVSTRTREIGIRLALGAEQGAPFRLVVSQGLMLAGIGSVVGLLGAAALTRYLRTLLFGVQPTDVITFAAVPIVLITVAGLACYVPARRAARIEPMLALRSE
jgi:putative ABC transport system permease protein